MISGRFRFSLNRLDTSEPAGFLASTLAYRPQRC